MEPIDDPSRLPEIERVIHGKPSLKALYTEFFSGYADCLSRCPADGLVVELGSGAGFARQHVPELITSDTIGYPGLDLVADATALPFADGTVRMICMTNVLHHIPDPAGFFAEAERVLALGGRLFIVDQHLGPISWPILKYLHHEPFRENTEDWAFPSTGPLSGANGALPWVIFRRDRQRFIRRFPQLELVGYRPHTPLRYWFTGGLKSWCLLPAFLFPLATWMDNFLCAVFPGLGSFANIELVRRSGGSAPSNEMPGVEFHEPMAWNRLMKRGG